MTQLLIDRATLEQLVGALNEVDQHVDLKRYDTAPNEVLFDVVMAALTAGRAALANADPTGWIAVSDRLPLEADGEVLARMRDGRPEIAWATYWHGANNGFAQWTFRDPDEDETPTHWMPLPAAPKEQP